MSLERLVAVAILLTAAQGINSVALAEPIIGRANVIDGDTIDIRVKRFCP